LTSTSLDQGPGRRWLRIAICLLICAIGALRFIHLQADFPNDSPWAIDQAKFTDEGWWANAAVMHSLTGHWYVAGDYNPAAALPVWPLLLSAVFHFSGVSVIAARALNVALSLATLGLVYLLVRRYSHPGAVLPALAASLLLALSPFAFVFARLAILDTLVIFELCLSLLVASSATSQRTWPLLLLPALVTIMLLTKTTSALLIPSIFWLVWTAMGRKFVACMQVALAVAVLPAALVKAYAALVAACGYGGDYKYFFSVNALDDFDWHHAFSTLIELLRNCFWIDRVLYPTILAILLLAVVWKRKLWTNPLFVASWLILGAQASFIFRLQDDYAPRYFLVMLPPVIWIVMLALDEALAHSGKIPSPLKPADSSLKPTQSWASQQLGGNPATPNAFSNLSRTTATLLLLGIAAAAAANAVLLAHIMAHPTVQFYDAANSIRSIVRSDPDQNPWIFGVSGSQLSLLTGIPSINDAFGTEDMAKKVEQYAPGWYLAWTGIPSDYSTLFSPYRLEKVASYPAFDDLDRTPLILYKMVRRSR
jgi:hypothetical protein